VLADLESDLGSLLDHSGRAALLTEVLRVLAGDAQLANHGGVSSLLTSDPGMPSADGVGEQGAPVAELAAQLDSGELYAGVATPARTALALYVGHEDWAPSLSDLEDEHGLDAITRLVGLGLIAEGLSEQDSDGAASAWLQTSSGRAALAWFAAVEVVLAFGTTDDPVDADKVLELLDTFFDAAIDAWAEHASERALARARIIVNNWTDALCPAVEAGAAMVSGIAAAVRGALGDGADVGVDALVDEAQALGLYRSLVARHVGELIHGEAEIKGEPVPANTAGVIEEPKTTPEQVPEPESESESAPEQVNVQEDRLAEITAGLSRTRDALVEAGEALSDATTREAELSGSLVTLDEQIEFHHTSLKVARQMLETHQSSRSRLAEEQGTNANDRAGQSTALTALSSRLLESESALGDACEVRDARSREHAGRVKALSAASASHQEALVHQLACMTGVRDAYRAMRALMSSAEDAPVHAIDDQVADVRKMRSRAKDRVAELRKGRRAAARQMQSIAASAGATHEAIAKIREDLEESLVTLKRATSTQKGLASKLASNEGKLRKRCHRVDDLEDRQAGADELVQDLTDAIGHTRDELDGVIAAVEEGRQAAAVVRTERRRQIRQRLSALAQQRDEHRAALIPLTADIGPQAEALEEKTRAFDEASVALATATDRLKNATTAQRNASQAKRKALELTKAALGMLRNNAKRLEEAHQSLRAAQAAADGLSKERNLALGKKERVAQDVVTSRREEEDATARITEIENAIEQAQSAIDRNAGKLARATERVNLARAEQVKSVRSEIEGKRARISALREQIAEAIEDREGLAVAEVRVDSQVVDLKVARSPLVAQVASLKEIRTDRQESVDASRRTLVQMKGRISALGMDVDGAGLSIRGLESGVASRRRQIASHQGRLAVLEASIQTARLSEDEAVERVADFQSWVERTQASIARLTDPKSTRHPPAVPPPPPAPRSAKVDRLLAKLQPKTAPIVPDPSAVPEVDGASTVMVDRQALGQQYGAADTNQDVAEQSSGESEDAATEMFSPEDLVARLTEDEGEATVMMPRTQRRPKRTRDD